MDTKICRKCNTEKDKSEFYHHARVCKICRLSRVKEYSIENKEKLVEYHKNRYQKNKEQQRPKKAEYMRTRRKIDILFALRTAISRLIRESIIRDGYKKSSKTEVILGCTFEEFKIHLESKFEPWMSWNNRGLYNGELKHGWDIDHIIPVDQQIRKRKLSI